MHNCVGSNLCDEFCPLEIRIKGSDCESHRLPHKRDEIEALQKVSSIEATECRVIIDFPDLSIETIQIDMN